VGTGSVARYPKLSLTSFAKLNPQPLPLPVASPTDYSEDFVAVNSFCGNVCRYVRQMTGNTWTLEMTIARANFCGWWEPTRCTWILWTTPIFRFIFISHLSLNMGSFFLWSCPHAELLCTLCIQSSEYRTFIEINEAWNRPRAM